MMDKHTYLLHGLNLATARGIEIGALDRPVVPPSTPGIFYVDYTDTETLRERYRDDPNVDVSRIVSVNGIWGTKTLLDAAGAAAPVDFVIASHVIEHVPDLITWLQELASVLRPQGEVRLAIPDKRFTFDVLRAESDFADVLSAYLVRARVPQPRQVIDHMVNYAPVDCASLWANSVDLDTLAPYHPISSGEAVGRDVLSNGTYHDVHCWVFTPLSFVNLMARLAHAGHVSLKCLDLTDTLPNTLEFFATLQRCDDKAEVSASWSRARDSLRKKATEQGHTLSKLKQRIAQLEGDLAELQRDKQAAVNELLGSTSWRITAPLRSVVTWLRRKS